MIQKQITIQAIIKEVERMHNPFWLGTPHFSSEDFVYNGQYIPKDTVLVLNTYSMHHDPERYPEPFTFDVSLQRFHYENCWLKYFVVASPRGTSMTARITPNPPILPTHMNATTGYSA